MTLCKQLKKLNPGKEFFWDDENNYIGTDCDIRSIKCPEGFYVRNVDKAIYVAEITNKHNTNGNAYESYMLHQLFHALAH